MTLHYSESPRFRPFRVRHYGVWLSFRREGIESALISSSSVTQPKRREVRKIIATTEVKMDHNKVTRRKRREVRQIMAATEIKMHHISKNRKRSCRYESRLRHVYKTTPHINRVIKFGALC